MPDRHGIRQRGRIEVAIIDRQFIDAASTAIHVLIRTPTDDGSVAASLPIANLITIFSEANAGFISCDSPPRMTPS